MCFAGLPGVGVSISSVFRGPQWHLHQIFFLLILFLFVTASRADEIPSSPTQQQDNASDFIGFANMEADGTIVLQLDATPPGGGRAHGYFRYPPDHPKYRNILRHVGPLKPGESAPVRPWPETSGSPSTQGNGTAARNRTQHR